MKEDDKNTEAAAPARPISVAGRTLLISPANPSTSASVFAVIRKRTAADTPLARLVNDPAFKLLSAAAQTAAAVEGAKAQVKGETPLDGVGMVLVWMEPEVLAFAVWLHARTNHPEVTLEEIRQGITEENAAAVFQDFFEASGLAALGPNWNGLPG